MWNPKSPKPLQHDKVPTIKTPQPGLFQTQKPNPSSSGVGALKQAVKAERFVNSLAKNPKP